MKNKNHKPEDICECGHIKERHSEGVSEFWNEYTDKWESCKKFKPFNNLERK